MSKNYIVIISSLFLFVFIYYIKLMPSQNKMCHGDSRQIPRVPLPPPPPPPPADRIYTEVSKTVTDVHKSESPLPPPPLTAHKLRQIH